MDGKTDGKAKQRYGATSKDNQKRKQTRKCHNRPVRSGRFFFFGKLKIRKSHGISTVYFYQQTKKSRTKAEERIQKRTNRSGEKCGRKKRKRDAK